ncbi:glycosyl transferase family A [[Phormidium ambiguum] IAM M-71]|uniref:Glycosyl transferase family A n=1 Tax=[Phormidium ambiguum] IAM M-71 TaxID=454136 RepID=A0A1U7IA25_9CYAN|nr:glycosyltransferase [Phormidium ambiguum]OKH33362.1 glycosyl transferase family A [Phormidium ambiguum IAM M-71]
MRLISVIIPAYNSEKTIKETIESVLNQTFSDFELIVVNDGSTDSTLEIVNNIKDSRMMVFTYPNAGVAVSRNRGVSHSSGEFVSFLDADDLWTADKLEAQLKALQENPEAAVAYSWLDSIDESGNFLRQGERIKENGDIYTKLLLIPFVSSGSNGLIRRQAFIEIGGFDESLAASQDYDFYLRLAARYHFVCVPEVQILYRILSGSMSTNIHRLEATSILVRERAFQESPQPLLSKFKQYSLGNFYKDFTFKLLNMPPERERGWQATKLFWKAVEYDPALLRRRIFWKVILRIIIIIIMPSQQAEMLLGKMNKVVDIRTLYVLMRREP